MMSAVRAGPIITYGMVCSRSEGRPPGRSLNLFASFWLNLYLFGQVDGFAPPAPYTLDELDPAGLLPDRRYTRDELLSYLDHGRQKCREAIGTLTDDKANRRCTFLWGEVSYAELLLYNMRHIQEHGAQLNLFLGQEIGKSARWVAQTKSSLGNEPRR